MGTELLQYCNQFFTDFDFLLMLFHYSILMFFSFIVMKLLVPIEFTQTNLTFYMVLITLMLVLSNLRKGSFPGGLSKLTDETKVQILFAFKSFILVWCALIYSEGAVEKFFGLDMLGHHELLVRKINQVFALSGNKVSLAPEFTYAIFALISAAISFLTVKQSINFAFYFYVMTRSASREGMYRYLETRNEGHRFTFGQLIKLLYANFLAPVFIAFLFMHELTGSLAVSMLGMSELTWSGVRLLLVLCTVYLRFLIYREEL